jgi:hypothetical protein
MFWDNSGYGEGLPAGAAGSGVPQVANPDLGTICQLSWSFRVNIMTSHWQVMVQVWVLESPGGELVVRTLRRAKTLKSGCKDRHAQPLPPQGHTARLRNACAIVVVAVIGSMLSVVLPSVAANATNACPPIYALVTGSGIALRTNCSTSTEQLTTSPNDSQPALSPDGSEVAFVRQDTSTGTNDVWTVPAAGGAATQVTHVGWTAVWSVSWTTDSQLVLSADTYPSGTAPSGNIYTVNTDGTGLTSISPGFPAYEPTSCGSKIVVEHYDDSAVSQLYSMNTDGSDITQITSGSIESDEPACTPDNRWVVFDKYDNLETPNVNGLYAVPITGGSPVLLRPYGTDGLGNPTVSGDWTMAFWDISPNDPATGHISFQWLGGTTAVSSGSGQAPSFAHGDSTTPAPAGFPVAYGSTAPAPTAFVVNVDDSSVGKAFGSVTGKKVLDSRAFRSTACQSGWEVSTANNTAFVLHIPTSGNVAGTRVDVGQSDSSYLVPGQTALYCAAFTQLNQVFDVRYDVSDSLARTTDAALLVAEALTPLPADDAIDLANFISKVASIPQLQKIGACLGSPNPLCAPRAITALMANSHSRNELLNDLRDYFEDLGHSVTLTWLETQLPKHLLQVITTGLWVAKFIGQVTLSPVGYVAFETAP